MTLALLLALAGAPVQFCVGTSCAAEIASLPAGAVGPLIAVDRVGNTAPWGLFCSWRGVLVRGQVELTSAACFEARSRLDDAAEALTRAGLVSADEWPHVIATSIRTVLIYPAGVLEVPRGEEFVAGVYVPDTRTVHLTTTLEGAAHELFHAVLKARGGSIDHDQFTPRVDALHRAARTKYRGRPVL